MEDRRSVDPLLIEIKTRLVDHFERYERDLKKADDWRLDTTKTLVIHCDFIKRISPIYRRLCWLFGIFTIASIGVATTSLWRHISWH